MLCFCPHENQPYIDQLKTEVFWVVNYLGQWLACKTIGTMAQTLIILSDLAQSKFYLSLLEMKKNYKCAVSVEEMSKGVSRKRHTDKWCGFLNWMNTHWSHESHLSDDREGWIMIKSRALGTQVSVKITYMVIALEIHCRELIHTYFTTWNLWWHWQLWMEWRIKTMLISR